MGAILGILLIEAVIEVIQELLPGYEGTIQEFEDFDCEADCVRLHDALHGSIRVDEDELIDVLCNRNNAQRQEIVANYVTLYGEELYDRVNRKVKRDELRHVLKGMLLTPLQYDCRCLRKAMKGIGSSDDDVIAEILAARPNEYIESLKEEYQNRYDTDLVEEVLGNTRGEYERFMFCLLLACREQGMDAIDPDQAQEDAQELYDAGEDRWFFTDESVFTRICARRSWMQIRLIDAAYNEIAGHDLECAIDEEIDGDLRKAYKAVVRMAKDPARYFARNMYKAMRGLGTDDDALQRGVIFTSEWGLETIKAKYEEEFGSCLADDVESELRGDYKDIMLAIIK